MTSEEEPIAETAYDEVANTYDQEVETNAYNVDLEFPGTTALVPDVDGSRILDAACGTGRYTEWLVDQGAEVVGADVSEAILGHARERVGDRAAFHRVDLGNSLDFAAEDAFDGVVSALALDYVEDWLQIFSEFARLLKRGGFFVFSVGHPVEQYVDNEDVNYFQVELLKRSGTSKYRTIVVRSPR